MQSQPLFKDRNHAGKILADELANEFIGEWMGRKPVVIALPRGGVPVAYPIAKRLDVPLDVLLVKKLGVPTNPEYAFGAIAEDGKIWLNREALRYVGLSRSELNEVTNLAVREMQRQEGIFRDGRQRLVVENRPVILVDDGLATGSTMLAAVASLKSRKVSEIVVAVPVASQEAVRLLEGEVDRVYVAHELESLRSVGEWYENFEQVSDEEVIDLLHAAQAIKKAS